MTSLQDELVFTANLLGVLAVTALASHPSLLFYYIVILQDSLAARREQSVCLTPVNHSLCHGVHFHSVPEGKA